MARISKRSKVKKNRTSKIAISKAKLVKSTSSTKPDGALRVFHVDPKIHKTGHGPIVTGKKYFEKAAGKSFV